MTCSPGSEAEMTFTVEKTIRISDVLTIFAVTISLVALMSTLSKDREERERDHASRVRSAAAAMLIKVDRWQALQLSLYQELQPTFVELSEQLLKNYNTRTVRDELWKRISFERSKISAKVVDEQLSSAYSDLIATFPAAREKLQSAHEKLAEAESLVTDSFMAVTEARILPLQNQRESYETAKLGNLLRDAAAFSSRELKRRSDDAAKPLRDYLLSVIAKKDSDIVQASRSGS
ncbi:hypothetical protein GCM10007918_38150 [Piscinibacter gummiphilus]|nr:hypothetical protein GCM10007918_38150 [Piscinibacter gummiphilus]